MSQDKVKVFFNRLDYLQNSSDRIAIRSNLVKKFLGDLQNISLLDIGCGDGSLSLQFLHGNNQLTLIDISENMIATVREKIPPEFHDKVTLINDSFEAVPEHHQFDIILCVGVIAHVPDVNRLFEKIGHWLKPNGRLVIETTPNPYPIGKILYPYYYLRGLVAGEEADYSKNRLKISSLLQYAETYELDVIDSVRYSFPLPGMSHWPQSLKLRYTLFTLNNPIVSRFGSEHVYLMKKRNST